MLKFQRLPRAAFGNDGTSRAVIVIQVHIVDQLVHVLTEDEIRAEHQIAAEFVLYAGAGMLGIRQLKTTAGLSPARF